MYENLKCYVIIPAAGKGTRMNMQANKLLLELNGKTVIENSISVFENCSLVDEIIIVSEDENVIKTAKTFKKVKKIVRGGIERQDSVKNGLESVCDKEAIILIHDGARPFINDEIIKRVIEKTFLDGNASPAVGVKDTIKIADDFKVKNTPERNSLYAIQTPQGFKLSIIKSAYEHAYENSIYGTDDAYLLECMGLETYLVQGDYDNIKITTKDDIRHLKRKNMDIKVGLGYDVHKLVKGRDLIIGGVKISHDTGLLGHSDADVLTHAVMDSILGALGLGDIGRHFPDTDSKYKGANSLELLKYVAKLLDESGYRISNLDCIVVAQRPKILPYVSLMKENLAMVLDISPEKINIKGTTTEKLGFEGREEGISSLVNCLIIKN